MEAQAAPRDNPQKLGLRASTVITWSNEGASAALPELTMLAAPDARAEQAGARSRPPRGGSRTVSFRSGVIRRPASPTMKKAIRQLIRLVMKPPSAIPTALPMGMPKEYTLNARARSLA